MGEMGEMLSGMEGPRAWRASCVGANRVPFFTARRMAAADWPAAELNIGPLHAGVVRPDLEHMLG